MKTNKKYRKEVRKLFGDFEFSVICQCVLRRLISFKVYERYVFKYLRRFFSPILPKRKSGVSSETSKEIPRKVWTLWWQGEEDAPELIKVCIDSQRKAFSALGADYIVLTKENWERYISLPRYILDKVDSGAITLTHLSDIIRAELLKDHGGMWIDATVFCTGQIEQSIFENGLYTVKCCESSDYLTRRRWTGFIFGSQKGSPLFSFIADAFAYYWKIHNALIAYLLIDYLIAIAYEDISEIRREIDDVAVGNRQIWALLRKLNQPFDAQEWEKITKDTTFFKLSYKDEFNGGQLLRKTEDGSITYWGHLLETR